MLADTLTRHVELEDTLITSGLCWCGNRHAADCRVTDSTADRHVSRFRFFWAGRCAGCAGLVPRKLPDLLPTSLWRSRWLFTGQDSLVITLSTLLRTHRIDPKTITLLIRSTLLPTTRKQRLSGFWLWEDTHCSRPSRCLTAGFSQCGAPDGSRVIIRMSSSETVFWYQWVISATADNWAEDNRSCAKWAPREVLIHGYAFPEQRQIQMHISQVQQIAYGYINKLHWSWNMSE